MRHNKQLLILVMSVIAIACSQQGAVPTSLVAPSGGSLAAQNDGPMAATVLFGNDSAGSPFDPGAGHDRSGHARDTLIPGTVVINRGGTVTFKIGFVHQIAVYQPGKGPEDVNTSALDFSSSCFGIPLITDSVGRIYTPPAQPCTGGPTSVSYTFNQPGKYLVICTLLPHFNIKMYGWVVVQD
jgi:plastocyanin